MYSITDDSLEDYIDLDTLLRFPFQKLVESVTGFVGPPHLQLFSGMSKNRQKREKVPR
jgi:hypothetical protein